MVWHDSHYGNSPINLWGKIMNSKTEIFKFDACNYGRFSKEIGDVAQKRATGGATVGSKPEQAGGYDWDELFAVMDAACIPDDFVEPRDQPYSTRDPFERWEEK